MRTSHGRGAGRRPDHEQAGDRGDVEKGDVLEPERVRRLQREEAEQQSEGPDAEQRREHQRGRHEHDRDESAARSPSSPRAIGRSV